RPTQTAMPPKLSTETTTSNHSVYTRSHHRTSVPATASAATLPMNSAEKRVCFSGSAGFSGGNTAIRIWRLCRPPPGGCWVIAEAPCVKGRRPSTNLGHGPRASRGVAGPPSVVADVTRRAWHLPGPDPCGEDYAHATSTPRVPPVLTRAERTLI